MAIFDAPINTNEQNWGKILHQKLPILLYLFNRPDAQLDEALKRAARDHAGQLLVVRVNVNDNPHLYAQYNRPILPALITIREREVQSTAAPAQVADITAHSAYLLGKGPKPAVKTGAKPTAKPASTATSAPMTVTDSSFRQDVLQSDLPVLVDFWAPWCGPCHMIAPAVEKIAQKYAGRIKVAKLNVDENPQTAAQYQTMSIPTLILYKQGQVAGRLVGVQPQAAIEQMIEAALQRLTFEKAGS